MMKLKLGQIPDDKPVRLTITVSAELAALLRACADAVGSGNAKPVTVKRIVPPMLERFIRTDRAFMRTPRQVGNSNRAFGRTWGGQNKLILGACSGNRSSDIEESPNQSRWRVDIMLHSDHCVARVLKQRPHDCAEARDQYRRR